MNGPPAAGVVGIVPYDGLNCQPVSCLPATLTLTSPSSATFANGTPLTGLDGYQSLDIVAELTGNTGGTLDLYIQTSPDGGTTWYDYIHFAQLAAGATTVIKRITVSNHDASNAITTVGKNDSPALAAGTVIGGAFNDRIRVKCVSGAGTTLGASQVIKVSVNP
jgi:hypothetical protein